MNPQLVQSYRACARFARSADSNFHYSFYLLPRSGRLAMWALYAYLRRTDDLGDSAQPLPARRAALAQWREALQAALAGQADGDPILPALVDTVARYGIPHEYLLDVLRGVEMDLDHHRYATFAELERYCEHVASAVGLACIHVFGFDGEAAIAPARHCGVAFQLTNILRDLKEDAARGRVYLPQEDLARFGYSADELVAGVRDERFRRLMRFQIQRAEFLYVQADALLDHLRPAGRRVLRAMIATYRALLDEIKRRDGDVFSRPVRLGRWQKLQIMLSAVLGGARRHAPPRQCEPTDGDAATLPGSSHTCAPKDGCDRAAATLVGGRHGSAPQ